MEYLGTPIEAILLNITLFSIYAYKLSSLFYVNYKNSCLCYCDAAEPWAYSFQDTASPIAEGIVDFHDHLFYFLILILVAVTWIIVLLVVDSLKDRSSGTPFLLSRAQTGNLSSFSPLWAGTSNTNRVCKASLKDLNHGSVIEIVWTLTPAFILVLIAFPSFRLLYLMDEIVEPLITVKAVGNQWYWTYEYTDFLEKSVDDLNECSDMVAEGDRQEINFESYMKTTDSLEAGELRLLETDNKVMLPIDTRIRIIATGADVIHSWAVPSLGVKIDAIPGKTGLRTRL
jgi:cytochrome c oxidase subunit 2